MLLLSRPGAKAKPSSHATPFSSRPESAEHTHVRIRKDVLFHIVNCLERMISRPESL